MTDKPTIFQISADELEHRMKLQQEKHDVPLHNVTDFIAQAIGKVLESLGVDTTQDDDTVIQHQIALGITILERPPEEMGKLSGFYILSGGIPIAIVSDAYLANDGLAYLDIYWIQKEMMERFGGVQIIKKT